MNDRVVGSMIRAARVRIRWRQIDLEQKSGVPVRKISRAERGRLCELSIGQLRAIGEAMDIVTEVTLRSRSGDLDRLVRAGHSALHEELARFFRGLPDWVTEHEVSYSVFGERGVIDIIAWHPRHRALLIIELKTEIVDVNDLLEQHGRRRRLAQKIAADRGWTPATVSSWVIVSESRTNRRRLASHATVLRRTFPGDGRSIRTWLTRPDGATSTLSFWPRARTSGRIVRRVRARPVDHAARSNAARDVSAAAARPRALPG